MTKDDLWMIVNDIQIELEANGITNTYEVLLDIVSAMKAIVTKMSNNPKEEEE